MSCQAPYNHVHPPPQVFAVDGGRGLTHHDTLPGTTPPWSYPRAQEMVRKPGQRRGCMGVSSRLALVVLLLFALVFASLGIGVVWTVNLQKELKEVRKMIKDVNKTTEELVNMDQIIAPQKQIDLYEAKKKEVKEERPAAHVIARFHQDSSHKTLRWETRVGQAFRSGGVTYRIQDGALQVNQTGLYYIYCRVELIFRVCLSSSSFDHSVFVRRAGYNSPLTLMDSQRRGFCPTHQGRAWTVDSYLGSVFQLQKDDRVLVNVSHPHFLSHLFNANVFGLYMI